MEFAKPEMIGFDMRAFSDFLLIRGVKARGGEDGTLRFVTHHDVNRADMDAAVAAIRKYIVRIHTL